MLAIADFDRLLLPLFEIVSTGEWSAWLASLKDAFASTSAVLAPLGPSAERWLGGVSAGVSDERRDAYRDHYHSVDLWMKGMRSAPLGLAHSMEALVPDRELYQSEIYNDFMKPAGRRYALGLTLEAGGSRFIVVLVRHKAEGDFDGHDSRALERVGGFLKRTLTTQRHLSELEGNTMATSAVLDQSGRAVMLLDRHGKVIHANTIGAGMLAAEDHVGSRRGQLAAMSRTDEPKLRRMVEAAIAQPGEPLFVTLAGAKSGRSVTGSVAGVADRPAPTLDLGAARAAAIVILTDQARRAAVPPKQLGSVFGLTAQEARTASLLLSGLDLTGVASRLSIGRETVRYHLKSLFAKTGTHSQRELVQHMSAALPPLALDATRLSSAD